METKKFVDSYIAENRGYITASKLKEFIKSPEQYFLKYIKEVPSLKEKEEKHFTIGTAIDDFISYGENAFYKKYYIDEGLNISQMKERLILMGQDEAVLKGLKKPDFEELLYGDRSAKIRLTAGDGETVLGCVNELQRQTLFDKDGGYECQKTFIGQYKGLKLKGTLDRYKTGMLRDTKSCANITKFIWEWKEKLGYDVSMSFYWVLVHKATGDKPKLLLDTVEKTFPYASRIYEIPQGDIISTVDQTIIPALDTLDAITKAYEETGNEDLWKVRSDFTKIATCDMYPIMESAIQEDVEQLQ